MVYKAVVSRTFSASIMYVTLVTVLAGILEGFPCPQCLIIFHVIFFNNNCYILFLYYSYIIL